MTVVHIHARDIVHHDAVGSFCRQVAALLARSGYDVRLWAEHTNVEGPHPVGHRRDFESALSPADIIFFNHSIYDPLLDDILRVANPKVAYFHNVTPPELIDPADALTVENCRLGLAQCGKLGGFDGVLANSQFSAQTLINGMDVLDARRWREQIVVCPPLIGADRWQHLSAVPGQANAVLRGLFVGRLVPHKGVDEILDVFNHLAATLPSVELTIVGGPTDGTFVQMLREKAAGISQTHPASTVIFRHRISDEELKGIYQQTDFCIAHSTHEGFCVPALDALSFNTPMFVSPLPAVMEVLGDAALLIPPHDHAAAAAAIAAHFASEPASASHSSLRRKRLHDMTALADGHLILEAVQKVTP